MHKSISASTMLGGLLLLSACGGGGGGSDNAGGPVPLATEADASRELSLVLGEGPLSVVLGSPLGIAPFNGPVRASARALPKDAGNCFGGGRYDFRTGTLRRDFKLLSPVLRDVEIEYEQINDSLCQEGEGQEITDGRLERGWRVTPGSENPARYESRGLDGKPYSEEYQSSEGFTTRQEYLYTLEWQETEEGEAAAALGEYRNIQRAFGQSYTVEGALGAGATPFRARLENGRLFLDGSYSYGSSLPPPDDGCKGGRVTVSTPQPLRLDGGDPVGGQLRLVSGSASVLYSFRQDGSATLRIGDGDPIELTAEQVGSVIREGECSYGWAD